jgi:alkanesulfonate monooxygenase
MGVEIVGMIGVKPDGAPGAAVHVIGGGIDKEYLVRFASTHEDAGFDRVLVGYTSTSADGFLVTQYAAAHTTRLQFLLAHRPGFVAPTLAARKAATLDHFSDGRLALHIITGGSDFEQRRDGDLLDHDTRYRRTGEYLDVMRMTWTEPKPFTHEGEFYQFENAYSDVKPVQQPSIPVYFGGMSGAALQVAGRHADVFALWGEPRAAVKEKMDEVLAAAAPQGRKPRFSVSTRPIIAPTEGEAWDKARETLHKITGGQAGGKDALGRPQAEGARRLMRFASESEVHDERLWMPIAEAAGGSGNTTALVGTPQQVADSLLAYYDLGVETLLIRGFDPLNDAADYGRELIPLVREGVARREREAATVGAS